MFNQKVDTPLGQGIEQGKFAVTNGAGMVVAVHKLVRFTLNDVTAKHLRDTNCLTPNAIRSALFHFDLGEQL